MKRLFLILVPMVVVSACLLLSNNTLMGLLKTNVDTSLQTGKVSDVVYASTDLGFILEAKTELKNSIRYLKQGEVVGECVWIAGGLNDLDKICDRLGLMILDKYYVDNKYMIEGSSALLDYFLEGTNVNVQIAVSGEKIVVGSPIIYGSY